MDEEIEKSPAKEGQQSANIDDVENKEEKGEEENATNENKERNQEEENNNNDKENKPENVNDENKENEGKMEIDSEKEKTKEEEDNKKEETPHERSELSLEGAKSPLSMYTRRVMDISKIENYLQPNSSRGQVGGRNLGNTCFMNSSIACISNCTELTYYFLKGDYKKDINEDNSLGLHGELAKRWGELMNEYWVENTSVGDPSDFKSTIGSKATRFRGFGQQDSNEFMSVFLDYLNEDLNGTTKKQYIEMKEKGENESDEQCARRFWDCNLKRNDSIITDLFCGQFKSTITCPDCGHINITFDPFDTINLPLLNQKKYSDNDNIEIFHFFYIPKYCLKNPYRIKIKEVNKYLPLNDIVKRIKQEENFIYNNKLDDDLLIVDMLRREKFGYANLTDPAHKFDYREEYIYSFNHNPREEKIKIPMYLFEKKGMSEYPRMIFIKEGMKLNDLRRMIYIYLRKYILSPFLKENEEKDNISLEIEKYLKDKKNELDEEKLIELINEEYKLLFNDDNQEKETKMEIDDEEKNTQKDNNEENKEKEKEKEKIDEEKKEDNNGEKKEEKIDVDEEKKDEEKKDEEKKDEEKKGEEKKEEKKEKTEKEKLIEKFIKDLPFTYYIKKERTYYNEKERIDFFDKENFNTLSEDFKEDIKLKTYNDSLDKLSIDLNDYEIKVEFNEDSKYINKDTFNLDYFDDYQLDYKKKEEPKKKEGEEEEEDDGKMTLEKCLKKFIKEEQLEEGDEWYCSGCKKHVLAKKKLDLYYLPKILIICFKRFIKDSSYSWEKNDSEVFFPIENMDMKNFVIGPDKDHSVYDLFAVSQHYGSTGFGHYTAVCKNNGKWFSYNDSSCSETNENDALSSAAYVLFYRRQTD